MLPLFAKSINDYGRTAACVVKQRAAITKKFIHHAHPNTRMKGARLTYYDSDILFAVYGVTNRKGIGNIAKIILPELVAIDFI